MDLNVGNETWFFVRNQSWTCILELLQCVMMPQSWRAGHNAVGSHPYVGIMPAPKFFGIDRIASWQRFFYSLQTCF